MSSSAVARSDEQDRALLLQLEAERAHAKEHAVRQCGHLAREIEYGYPPAHIRPARRMTNDAVSAYIRACEDANRVARRIDRRKTR